MFFTALHLIVTQRPTQLHSPAGTSFYRFLSRAGKIFLAPITEKFFIAF